MSQKTRKARFLAVQVHHRSGMMAMGISKSGNAKMGGAKMAAGQGKGTVQPPLADMSKTDWELTEKIMKKAGGRVPCVLDKADTAHFMGKTAGTYGASLGTWFLLGDDRKVTAIGHGPETLQQAVRDL